MSTQGWQSVRSTNAGILVESAHYTKVFQNNLNTTPKVPMIWTLGAESNTITNHTQPNNTQFLLPRGYYIVIMQLQVFSPTSAKLQYEINYEVGGVVQPEIGFSAILIATDYAHTDFIFHLDVPANNTLIEFFGVQSGSVGTIDTLTGFISFIRLSNFIN